MRIPKHIKVYNQASLHHISIKEPYLTQIKRGEKTAEGRVNGLMCSRLRAGEYIQFYNYSYSVLCKIRYFHKYSSFERMLQDEGLCRLLPRIKNINEGLAIYRKFPGSHRVKQYGAVAIGVEVIE